MLKIRNLEKRYGAFEVLKGLNMTIEDGDIYGFLGRNGCGKSTTMNIISDIIKKDNGTIEFSKENPVIGYLPETPMLFGYMNGYEYLEYIGACCKYEGDIKERIKEVLAVTGMTEGAKRRIRGYSRGMNQRLGIAATIFNNPDLLILDEPTSALDPQGRAEVMSIIQELAKTGCTIILCTHILSDVERVANKIGIIRDGVMAVEGPIEEVRERYTKNTGKLLIKPFGDINKTADALSGIIGNFRFEKTTGNIEIPIPDNTDEQKFSADIMTALCNNGIAVSLFEIEKKSLEEIYLETIN